MANQDHGEYREDLYGEHPHTYDHHEPKYLVIAALGIATVVGLVLVAIGIQFFYEYAFEEQTYKGVLSQPNWQLQELHKKEAQELHSYGYIDQAKGTVRIPIDDAMRLTIQEAAQGRQKYPTNAYPVKTAAQLATNQPGVSQPGAAAAIAAQKGATSSPNAQQSTTPQQPNK